MGVVRTRSSIFHLDLKEKRSEDPFSSIFDETPSSEFYSD